jgi:hypothetical protein
MKHNLKKFPELTYSRLLLMQFMINISNFNFKK